MRRSHFNHVVKQNGDGDGDGEGGRHISTSLLMRQFRERVHSKKSRFGAFGVLSSSVLSFAGRRSLKQITSDLPNHLETT